jgi:hypothetical protein
VLVFPLELGILISILKGAHLVPFFLGARIKGEGEIMRRLTSRFTNTLAAVKDYLAQNFCHASVHLASVMESSSLLVM